MQFDTTAIDLANNDIFFKNFTRTITRWNMSMLESCDRIKTDVLRLRFDTIKRDKRERIYNVEEGSGQVNIFFQLASLEDFV